MQERSQGEPTDGVDPNALVQSALNRLRAALLESMPGSPLDFFQLSARYIRRELLDLGRAMNPLAENPAGSVPPSVAPSGEATASWGGSHRAAVYEIHAQVEKLPETELAVVDLLIYQELPLSEAAAVLGIEIPALKRHWLRARLHLHEALGGPIA
jgi:DNA-directed RNA polymerase specialized sigma24 family protein